MIEKENIPTSQNTEVPVEDKAAEDVKQADEEEVLLKQPKINLAANFERFRKKRADEIRMKKLVQEKNKNVDRKDPALKKRLREKFIQTARKYLGVPYAKRYHKPGDPLYDAPLFLDCCALTRQVC